MQSKQIKTKRIRQQLNMVFNILALVFDPIYQALLDSLPPYKDACESLQTMAESLRAKLAIYSKLLKSLAEGKNAARIALAQVAYAITSVTRAYCLKNGLNDEALQLKCTLSQLKHMPFAKLIEKMLLVIPIVELLLPNLSSYNVTIAKVNQWKGLLQIMQNLMSGPENAIKYRKTLGDEIMNDTEAMLKFFNDQVCPLVADFSITDSLYYNRFQEIKRIGQENTHHTRLLAHCQSELGNPFYGITVTVDAFTDPQTGKTYAADSAITDPNGDAEVIEFFAGNRTVTVSGPNIETTTFPAMQFERGKAISHTFTVRPAFTNIPAPQESKEKAEK